MKEPWYVVMMIIVLCLTMLALTAFILFTIGYTVVVGKFPG